MASQQATAFLRPGHSDRVLAGHPWIYEKSIRHYTRPPADGELIQVKDSRKRFLGVGFHNSQSRVRIRMAASRRVATDTAYFSERIEDAQSFRQKHFPGHECYRVVNAESDRLGGLIVDRYGDTLSVQILSLAFVQRRNEILAALTGAFPERRIIESHDAKYRRFEGLPEPPSQPTDCPQNYTIQARINDLNFAFDLGSGHKTGAYLDQQANYRAIGELVAMLGAPRVIDCFSYQGGFALHAAKSGAKTVLGLEQNSDAVIRARENARINNLTDACRFESANVFDWFKETGSSTAAAGSFDMIILDPPSFTRSRANLANAARGYKEIHLRALRLLRPGGILSTFSCSHHVEREFFLDVIRESALDARRRLRLVRSHEQPLDHPILPAVPETEYLKGFSFEAL